MSFRDWLKAGTLSTMLGFAAAQGANAQQAETGLEQDTTIVDPAQEVDYSKIEIDRVQIMYNGQPLRPSIQEYLTANQEFDDAQDAHDLNNSLQRKLVEQDENFMSLLVGRAGRSQTRGRAAAASGTHEINVEAYHGEEKIFTFDADDMTEKSALEAESPEDSTRTRTRRRGGGEEQEGQRTRTRGGDSGGQQQIPEPD